MLVFETTCIDKECVQCSTGNRLTGTLPEEVGLLEDLALMNMASNSFTGSLPESLFELEHLRLLNLVSLYAIAAQHGICADNANFILEGSNCTSKSPPKQDWGLAAHDVRNSTVQKKLCCAMPVANPNFEGS